MAINYLTLNAELTGDPQHYGYATIPNNDQVASLMNEIIQTTLTTALTSGQTAVVALAVQALPFAIPGSSTIELISGISTQQVTVAAAGAAAGATSIPTVSFTSNAAYPVGTSVYKEPVSATSVTAEALRNAVVESEIEALTQAARDSWNEVLEIAVSRPISLTDSGIRAQVIAIWGAGTTTRANLAALQTRAGSRAETVLGPGTGVSGADIAAGLAA